MIIHKGKFLTSVYPWVKRGLPDTSENKVLYSQTIDRLGVGAYYQGTFFLKIPKNCTSFFRDCLSYNEVDYSPEYNSVVIMRDPIDRWISGTLEMISKYQINYNLFQKRFINSVAFDRHTAEQNLFFPKNFDYNAAKFYYYNKNIIEQIQPIYFPEVEPIRKNQTIMNERKMELYEMVLDWVNQPDLNNTIKNYYKQDYNIIERYCCE